MNDGSYKMNRIGDLYGEDERKIYAKNMVSINKELTGLRKKIREEIKQNTCYSCGKEKTSYCNSHFIPRFCLRRISKEGEIFGMNSIFKLPGIKESEGVNEAGVFHLICNECDSKIFSNYEDPSNYIAEPSQIMMAEVIMKNCLKKIYQRRMEISAVEKSLNIRTNSELGTYITLNGLESKKLDIVEYEEEYEYAKRVVSKDIQGYYLAFYKKLDYIVPLAFQDSIALMFDFQNNIVNDIYNYSSKYKMHYLNLCVYPMNDQSVIFMFIKNEDKRYRQFYKDFKKLSLDEQLKCITYLIFAYSDKVYFHKKLVKVISNDKNIKEIVSQLPEVIAPTPEAKVEWLKDYFSLDNRNKIPNFLGRDFKMDS